MSMFSIIILVSELWIETLNKLLSKPCFKIICDGCSALKKKVLAMKENYFEQFAVELFKIKKGEDWLNDCLTE